MPTIFRRTHHILLADIYPHEISQTTYILLADIYPHKYQTIYHQNTIGWYLSPNIPYINAATEVNPITNHRELGCMKLAIPLWLGWCIQYALYGLLWLVTGIVYGIGLTSLLTQTHHIQYVWVVLLFFPITISYPMNINEPDCWLLKQTKQTQHIQSLFPTKPHQSIIIVLWIVLFVSWLCSMISMMNSHSPTRTRNGT